MNGRPPRTHARRGPLRLDIVVDLVDRGGAEMQLLTLVREFDRATVVPRLICLRRAGELADDFRAAGCEVVVLERRGRSGARTVARLARLVGRADAVLVCNHHRAALTLGRLAAVLVGVPSVVAVHDMGLRGRRSLPRDVVATLAFSRGLVALAPRHVEYLRRHEGVGARPWSRTTVHVVPHGVPGPATPSGDELAALRGEFGLDADAEVVGMVGRLVTEKDHETALRALLRLADRRRLRLMIVGGGPRADDLHDLVDRWDLRGRVILTGPRADVPRLLGVFDVLWQTSRDEAVPLAVLEAMTAGLPVVCTDCGALPDVVEDGREGHVTRVGDDAAVATLTARLLDDHALRTRLGRAAASRAAGDFAARTMAARYEAVLAEVSRPRGRSLDVRRRRLRARVGRPVDVNGPHGGGASP